VTVDYLLFMKGDVTVTPNPNEVAAVQYVEPDELRDAREESHEWGGRGEAVPLVPSCGG